MIITAALPLLRLPNKEIAEPLQINDLRVLPSRGQKAYRPGDDRVFQDIFGEQKKTEKRIS